MSKTANIMTRVEPEVKAKAEAVLERLGMSMSTAMTIYLNQIAIQNKIPFEIALNSNNPISLKNLNDEEFDALMDKAAISYASGLSTDIDEFKKELHEEIGL